jgi:RNA polymerase sigma-70 factor (ECF subfamily)
MVNISLEKFRKQHLMYPVEDIQQFDIQHYSDNVIEKITADELIEIIKELPPRYRMVFNLYVFEEMSHQEISEEMGIAEGTSKSNLARARDILKRKIATIYGDVKSNKNSSA